MLLTVCQRWRARAATGEAQFKVKGKVGFVIGLKRERVTDQGK